MLEKMAKIFKNEKGITTPEALMISGLIAVLALLVWQNLRPFMQNSANTIGGKTFNAVNAGNNANW